ncbi:hypothetical protein VB005_00370 [Metarhizium brunneum]
MKGMRSTYSIELNTKDFDLTPTSSIALAFREGDVFDAAGISDTTHRAFRGRACDVSGEKGSRRSGGNE